MQEYYIRTDNGAVHCCRWQPEGDPIAVVQIIHGIREYTARYDQFARYLASCGFLVIGADHPGHGTSCEDTCKRGYLKGGWVGTVKIIRKLYEQVHKQYPDIPYIMFGHSMGSYLLQTYLCVYNDLTAAVISGTGWQPEVLLRVGEKLCALERVRLGEHASSTMIENLMFSSYNRKFKPNRTENDWISSDVQTVDTYCADAMCTWKPSIQLCGQMLSAIRRNQDVRNLKHIRKNIPLFFISGQMDPVGDFGNGVLRTVAEFKHVGMKDVVVELYPNMRHECIHEIGKEKVMHDVVSWIMEKCVDNKGCSL